MDWKKNDVFQVQIEDMSDTGEGIGKTDGFTWFVKDAVIGDVVEARVMKTKKSYGFARLMQYWNHQHAALPHAARQPASAADVSFRP